MNAQSLVLRLTPLIFFYHFFLLFYLSSITLLPDISFGSIFFSVFHKFDYIIGYVWEHCKALFFILISYHIIYHIMTKCDNSSYGRTYLYKSYGWIHSGENAQTRFTILYNCLNVYKKQAFSQHYLKAPKGQWTI